MKQMCIKVSRCAMVPIALLPTLIFTWMALFSPGNSIRVVPPCDHNTFEFNVDECLSDFNKTMEDRGGRVHYKEACPWPDVKRIYNDLSWCVEKCASATWCKGHKYLVDDVFLEIHRMYFSLCGNVQDPPLLNLIMLIAPAIVATLLIPFLCIHVTTLNE
ncbi:receptor activity-modifying protein 1 [Nothobranchius furzeri]|uniref:Si:ch73-193i22.1 n=4 Tax=Nothobranchius TaxID=28779 RepID=A0A1A7ZRP1_NOTFU